MLPMHELEVWLRVYEEELRWARQHELLRSGATSFTVALTGALWAIATSDVVVTSPAMACLLIAFTSAVNLLAWYMVNKHYERTRRHQSLASALRKVVSANAPLGGHQLEAVRSKAHRAHKKGRRFHRWQNIRVYKLWGRFHLGMAVAGLPLILFFAYSALRSPPQASRPSSVECIHSLQPTVATAHATPLTSASHSSQ